MLNNYPDNISLLDYWTEIALEILWRELVKETQETNFTGNTDIKITETGENIIFPV